MNRTSIQEDRSLIIPVLRECDVVVVGGGPAGIAAAVSSARLGASTVLVEKNGWLGGMATSGLVHPFMPSYAGDEPINKGVFWEIVERLLAMDAAVHPATTKMGTGYTGHVVWPHAHVTPFDVEALKWVIQDLMEEAGVQLLLHSPVVHALHEGGSATGVVLESKSGRLAVTAKLVVDATGDGDLARFLDIPFNKGREESGTLQPATLFFRLGGVDRDTVTSYIREHPEERHFASFAAQAKERGEFIPSKHDVLFFYTPRDGEVAVNTTRLHGVDGTDVLDLTRAELELRKQVRTLVSFFRNYCPGFENSYITQTAQEVGIRETRRIQGIYELTREDILGLSQFPDNIAQCSYMIDVHDHNGTELFFTPVPEGMSYGIPYRCLIPRTTDNILFGGRCISSTPDAQASLRVMPPSFCTGQAAGSAAALCAQQGVIPRDLDVDVLRRELVAAGQVVDPIAQAGAGR